MTRAVRATAWCAGALAAAALLALASAVLALASLGVFAAPDGAWTTAVDVAGLRVRVNVVGLIRVATLPGTAHLLDGRSVRAASGTWRFTRTGDTLRVTCSPCRIQHAAFASGPVSPRAVALDLRRDDDRLEALLVVDALRVPMTARLRTGSLDIAWTLPPTELAALVRSLGDAVPEAGYARIEGSVEAQGTLSLPSRRASVRWSATGWEVGGLGTEALQYGWFRHACVQRDGTARWRVTGDGERGWSAIDAMGPYLPAAVLAAEDQRFHQHAGYDEAALASLLADLHDGVPARGASTVTQQLARTLITGGERTVARKLRELLYSIEMERTLGKARILELYLNTVDWGPGLCGAQAAARAYFNKSPARLTALESAWLASVLRNPHVAWDRQFLPRQPERDRAVQVALQMRDWPRRERQRFAAQPLAFAPLRAAARPAGLAPRRLNGRRRGLA
jgi:hypothetical protein